MTRKKLFWIVLGLSGLVVVLFASLHTFAVFYTDALWFSSVNLHSVWLKLFEIKVGLMLVFAVFLPLSIILVTVRKDQLAASVRNAWGHLGAIPPKTPQRGKAKLLLLQA